MTRTVVVGVGVDCGWEALSWAAEEAAAGGDRLVLCHVSPSGLADRTVPESRRLIELSHPRLGRTPAALRPAGRRSGRAVRPRRGTCDGVDRGRHGCRPAGDRSRR
jgi:hypothetical protein